MKTITISFLVVLLLLSGCFAQPESKEFKPPVLSEELKDCKFFNLFTGNRSLNVVRCPNSTTTTTSSSGKETITTVTIDK